jgi:acyl-CoA synthetase (AMP-forming)/AMP-acid ligase II
MRLIEHFDRIAERVPERAFLIDDHGTRSYCEVQRFSHRLAVALQARGVQPGARVAIYAPNLAQAFECVIGLLRAGCVWVPISTRNHLDDTVHVLAQAGAELLFFDTAYAESVEQIAARCPTLNTRVALQALDSWLADVPADAEYPDRSTNSNSNSNTDDEALATLFSSGGTTGRPKGVMMSHAGWETMIAGTLATQPQPHPVHLVAAPMTHAAGGSALAMLPMGATHVLLPGFDALRVMQAIEQHQVTHLFLPPTAVYKLLAHPAVRQHDYTSLRYFNYASAPMSPERVREALDVFGPVMMTSFGQTETGLGVTFFSPEEHAQALAEGHFERFNSCGRAGPFFRVAIMDEAGALLPAGERGEVVVRGRSVMQGYWQRPDDTQEAARHGWHHTGDIGVLDAEGWLTLVDRSRDMIVSGGFNIFPSEIEKVLLSSSAVQDCAVIGVPDALWGEAVKAVLELKPGASLDTGALETLCRSRLGSHQIPKSFDAWPELPRSPAGKVLKRVVREHYWSGQARRI